MFGLACQGQTQVSRGRLNHFEPWPLTVPPAVVYSANPQALKEKLRGLCVNLHNVFFFFPTQLFSSLTHIRTNRHRKARVCARAPRLSSLISFWQTYDLDFPLCDALWRLLFGAVTVWIDRWMFGWRKGRGRWTDDRAISIHGWSRAHWHATSRWHLSRPASGNPRRCPRFTALVIHTASGM